MASSKFDLSREFLIEAGNVIGLAFENQNPREYAALVSVMNNACVEEEKKRLSWFPPAIPHIFGVRLKRDFNNPINLRPITDLSQLAQRALRAHFISCGSKESPFDIGRMKLELPGLIGPRDSRYARDAAGVFKEGLEQSTGKGPPQKVLFKFWRDIGNWPLTHIIGNWPLKTIKNMIKNTILAIPFPFTSIWEIKHRWS